MAIEAMFDRFLIDASNLDALKNDKQVSYLDQLVITKLRDSFGPSETGQSRLG